MRLKLKAFALIAAALIGTPLLMGQISNPGLQQSGAVVVNNCVKWGPGLGQVQDAGAACGAGAAALANTHIFVGSAGNIATDVALSGAGDCAVVLANTGVATFTCTKTNSVAFAASATTDTTNAANISSGTLPAARLPNPAAATLGGVQSKAAVANNFLTDISVAGVVGAAQPTCANLSGVAASCGTDATNASNIGSGTLPAARLGNGLNFFVSSGPTAARTFTFPDANATVTTTVAKGTLALGTSAIGSAACATVATAAATGALTTDNFTASFNADPTAVTGYVPLTAGMLTIIPYLTAGNFNAKVCNNTSSSITPGAITLNWAVLR